MEPALHDCLPGYSDAPPLTTNSIFDDVGGTDADGTALPLVHSEAPLWKPRDKKWRRDASASTIFWSEIKNANEHKRVLVAITFIIAAAC